MTSSVCPRTCGQLSTAAVFISIGVVQLFAGIILLKSEYVYLLAGIDFITSIANVSVGSFLGISSSLWAKKPKQVTGKNVARQNILAGLYISVMVVNSVTAIVMIMGDGNKLLTIPENVDKNISAVLVLEILACAYVTSVCTPIVCIVVALVCLSGNRIQIHENMKERESIAKTESYGWVFKNNHGTGPKKLSDVINSPLNRNSSSSDDVFMEKKCCTSKRPFIQKFSKKSKSRNSISSIRELKNPLEILDYKRKKILQEITEPNKVFFSDDYLQFPDFNYGSYMETLIPRVKQSSLIHPKFGKSSSNNVGQVKGRDKGIQPLKPFHSKPDEVDAKLTDRGGKLIDIPSYKNKVSLNLKTLQSSEDVKNSMKRYYSIQYKNEKCCKNNSTDGNTTPPIAPNRYANSTLKNSSDWYYNPNSAVVNRYEKQNLDRNSSCIQDKSQKDAQNSLKSSVSAIKSETIEELRSKFNELPDVSTTIRDRVEFMKSFKKSSSKRSKCCESDTDTAKNSSEKVVSENAESGEIQKSTSWAGEVVPIAVRTPKINPGSIPVSAVASRCQSLSVGLSTSDLLEERNFNVSPQNVTEKFEFPQRAASLYDRSDKNKQLRNLDVHPNKISSTTQSEKKRHNVLGSLALNSIPESPAEETSSDCSFADPKTFVPVKGNSELKLTRANTCKTSSNIIPKHNGLKSTQSTHLLKRLWSSVGNEEKTDVSNLIMDIDSLVGLSEKELMDRTRRLRELRKTVIMRSKNASSRCQSEERGAKT